MIAGFGDHAKIMRDEDDGEDATDLIKCGAGFRRAQDTQRHADGTEWIFHLRDGVTFHDGSPLTADDVKASLDRNIEIGLVAYDFIGLGPIEVVDELTVRFTASAPRNVPLILSATFGMFIYKAEAAAAPDEWFVSGNDAGTGPYMLTSIEPSVRVVLDYIRGRLGRRSVHDGGL